MEWRKIKNGSTSKPDGSVYSSTCKIVSCLQSIIPLTRMVPLAKKGIITWLCRQELRLIVCVHSRIRRSTFVRINTRTRASTNAHRIAVPQLKIRLGINACLSIKSCFSRFSRFGTPMNRHTHTHTIQTGIIQYSTERERERVKSLITT